MRNTKTGTWQSIAFHLGSGLKAHVLWFQYYCTKVDHHHAAVEHCADCHRLGDQVGDQPEPFPDADPSRVDVHESGVEPRQNTRRNYHWICYGYPGCTAQVRLCERNVCRELISRYGKDVQMKVKWALCGKFRVRACVRACVCVCVCVRLQRTDDLYISLSASFTFQRLWCLGVAHQRHLGVEQPIDGDPESCAAIPHAPPHRHVWL